MTKILPIILISLLLAGCVADQKNRLDGTQSGATIKLEVPPNSIDTKAITSELGEKIDASTENTQNQLSGLITTSVSDLADTIKGVEANLRANLEAHFNANAEIKTKLDATINNQVELKAHLQNQIDLNNQMNAKLTAMTEITNKLNLDLNSQIAGQAGALNRIEKEVTSINAKAGRDVNMLPQTAVDLLVTNLWVSVIIILSLGGIATVVIVLAYRASRMREANRTNIEREERKQLLDLLTEMLPHIQPEKADEINHRMKSIRVRQKQIEPTR